MRSRIPLIFSVMLLFSCTDYVEMRDCSEIRIDVSDSLVVKAETVKAAILQEYGCCIGCNLDSLDLGRIEAAVDSIPCVLKGQAWTTRDGILHVSATARKPVVRLCRDNIELFCDADGYLFPIRDYPQEGIRTVSGDIPLKMRAGAHGRPESERQRLWLHGVTEVALHGFEGQISVTDGGELRLLPDGEDEVYLFGTPDDIEDKFRKIEIYTDRIRPVKKYKTVNLKYKGQIICRKDI